jgi:ABC-type phosphate/phosphonate transport system substrate-binding protein
LTGGLTAGPAVSAANDTLRFVSLMSENAREFCSLLVAYLADRVGLPCDLFEGPWQVGESELYAGAAHLGVVCGLQYVLSVDRKDRPGVELLAAPVMRGQRYGGQPVYFSDVVVRHKSGVRTFADLRGAAWAYNEPTSHSGYNLARFALAYRGEPRAFFGRLVASGSHLASLDLLLEGSIDAAAIDTTVLEEELRVRPWLASELRAIETLGPSPIWPVVASRALPERTRSLLRAALLRMHLDPAGIHVLARGAMAGFVSVSDTDYDPIRAMARLADQVEPWALAGVP